MIRFATAAVCALVIALGLPACMQRPPEPLTDTERQEAVATAARMLRDNYVFSDVGERAARAIESALTDGSYDAYTNHWAFAIRLTEDLQAVTHDVHVRASAPRIPMLGPAVRSARPQPRPRAEGGVWRADILADNVGYVEIISFPVLREFERPAARAMTAVRDTRALIVDMRRNGGGDPRSVGLLVSYFLDGSEPVHINSIVYREPGTEQFTTDENWSQQTPVSYTGKPVYVLTSGDTISGGEAFSYSMQALGRAEVVGSVTVGGANPCLRAPIARELDLCVPRGRAQNPITGTNWEGVGVMPDIEVPGEIALAEALERLGVTPAPTTIEQASLTRVYAPGR